MSEKFFNEQEILHLFQFIDSNNNMIIEKQELENALKKFGIETTYFDGIYKKIDINKDNKIHFEEFKNYVIEQEEKLLGLYNKLDKNRDGKFSLDDLKNVCIEYYPENKYDECFLNNIINNIDINHNGIVEFEEFRDILLFLPNKNIEFLFNWGQSSFLISELSDAFPIQFLSANIKSIKEETNIYYRFLVNVFAGGVSAIISRTLTAPLDRLKTLYQLNYKGNAKPPSILNGLIEIYRIDGFKGYFRGNLVNCLKASPDTSIKFACFELLKQNYLKKQEKKFLNQNLMNEDKEIKYEFQIDNKKKENKEKLIKPNRKITPFILFILGSISGLFSAIFIYPLHVLRIRLAASPTGTYEGIIDAVKKITEQEGRIRPFFSGLIPSSYLIVLNSGLNLMTYDMLRNFYCYYLNKKEIPVSYSMFFGAISAAITNIVCYPFQIVSTKMIMQGLRGENKTSITIFRDILRDEGINGFYKGFAPLINKLLIGSSISFSVYEKIRSMIIVNK